ncbi:DUF2784 domain-containing protein [Nocardia asteroides]|uniref:DUF2784 domain-containing protein n=1 Tax=Nocardia asteroides TaxID=1824 RepID=UPI001E54DBBF|nr:DUF2784 domain-containing protein [Nocardia asteroides]UGT61566.1 DUF2784 domain-containing protein [Nocardia asteroides]
MLFRLLADGTMVAHYAFVAYVVAGGFLAWRRPRTIWLHIAAVGWGFGGILIGYDCPLTALESWARERGGEAPLPDSGFIAHYLTGVLYPESALTLVQVGAATLVLGSWAGVVVLRRRVTPMAAA